MMRFIVRKATKGWMVWDTMNKVVAAMDGAPAVRISAETANRFAEKLNRDLEQRPTQTADVIR